MTAKIVVGGLVVKNDQLVLVKEKKNEIAGLWNFTLGGLEGNETVLEGAKREIEEESGYQVKMENLIGVY
ncbi:MAG: NUDIX domain-containing protein [Gammaproteobacteria bacterium]|nr:NUDIX domain-containing protein [Gammaproteobacteria bacterium]